MEKVVDITSSRAKIIYKLLPSDDPKQSKADIILAGNGLGAEDQTGRGLVKTIEYFEGLLSYR